jgi:hypothetical protein
MITWIPSFQERFANLLMLTKITKIQYINIATCERAFSTQIVLILSLETDYKDNTWKVYLELFWKNTKNDLRMIVNYF